MMRKLGIIGGVSWNSTALYYEQINKAVAARLGGLHSASLALESLDFAPVAAMQQAGDWDGVIGLAVEAGLRLKKSGCEGLLIASNTMHKTAGAVKAATKLPLIDIGAVTAERLVTDRYERVALLGTNYTMTEGFAREAYIARGRSLIDLSPEWRSEVHRIIYEELAAGRVVRESQRKLRTLITELSRRKVQAIVLGCTELVMAVDVRANVLPVYDTTALHARSAVEWILGAAEAAEGEGERAAA